MIPYDTLWYQQVPYDVCECTLVVGLPVRDDEARVVVSHLAETSGEDGGDVVEGLEGGQELVATLIMIMITLYDYKKEKENGNYDDADQTWA